MSVEIPKIVDSLSANESGRHKKVDRSNDKYNAAVRKKLQEHDCFNCCHFGSNCNPFKKCRKDGKQ